MCVLPHLPFLGPWGGREALGRTGHPERHSCRQRAMEGCRGRRGPEAWRAASQEETTTGSARKEVAGRLRGLHCV